LYWLIQLREAVKKVFQAQINGTCDTQLSKIQKHLNNTYDIFIKRYGYLHSLGNRRVFSEDPEYPLLLALENYDPDTETDIFNKRTIREYQPKTVAATAKDALIYSLSEKGRVDIDFMAALRSQPSQIIIEELQKENLIYLDPQNNQWVTEDEYLSGNVRSKLEIARGAVQTNPELIVNVKALEKLQPPELLPGDIYARLGSPWIPSQDIADLIAQTLNVSPQDIHVYHYKSTATSQGTLEIKSRLAVFNNLPEWRQLFWQVADILTDDDLNLPKPEKEYITQEVPATPEQLEFFNYVAQRAETIKAGRVDPTIDNMPRITTPKSLYIDMSPKANLTKMPKVKK
jgi:hypothetical protein